jgi:hypothetical protein
MNNTELLDKIKFLFYFSHIEHFIDIMQNGIFSRNRAEKELLIQEDFSDQNVQIRRNKKIKLSNSKEVIQHDLVNLFFNPLNPTLAVTQRDYGHENYVIYCINFKKLISDKELGFAFTDRNASVDGDKLNIYNDLNYINQLDFGIIHGEYKKDRSGDDYYDWKQVRSAEFLVYPILPPEYINRVLTTSAETKNYLYNEINSYKLNLKSFNGIEVAKYLDMYTFY